MRTIAKILLPAALLLLGGCKISDLSYQKGLLSIQVDDKHLRIDGRPSYRHTDNFGNLYLEQEMLRLKNGDQVAYERATTDPLYEFNLIPIQTIKVVFNARKVNVIYFKSSFYLAQLILWNGSVLNLAMEQFDDQRLTFIYGMPTSQMRKLLRELDPQATQKPMIERVVTVPRNSHHFLSQWSVQMVQLTPLITPLRYNRGLFF
jgi:hypothetical protein